LRIAQAAGDLRGQGLRRYDLRAGEQLLDLLRDRVDVGRAARLDQDLRYAAGLARHLLQRGQREVDVRGAARQRRVDEPDDRERRAVDRDRGADLELVLVRVAVRDEDLVRLAGGQPLACRELVGGDQAGARAGRVDAGDV